MATLPLPKPIRDRIQPPRPENVVEQSPSRSDRTVADDRAPYSFEEAVALNLRFEPNDPRVPPPGPDSEIVFSPG